MDDMLDSQASDYYDYEVARLFYTQGRLGLAFNKQLVAQVRSADTREDYETFYNTCDYLRTERRNHAPDPACVEEAPGTAAGATALECKHSDEQG